MSDSYKISMTDFNGPVIFDGGGRGGGGGGGRGGGGGGGGGRQSNVTRVSAGGGGGSSRGRKERRDNPQPLTPAERQQNIKTALCGASAGAATALSRAPHPAA